ncbi:MAG TPA: hypothetical protein VF223_05100 [Trebonia sp.]
MKAHAEILKAAAWLLRDLVELMAPRLRLTSTPDPPLRFARASWGTWCA